MTDTDAEARATLKASLKVGTTSPSSESSLFATLSFFLVLTIVVVPLTDPCGLGGERMGQIGGGFP